MCCKWSHHIATFHLPMGSIPTMILTSTRSKHKLCCFRWRVAFGAHNFLMLNLSPLLFVLLWNLNGCNPKQRSILFYVNRWWRCSAGQAQEARGHFVPRNQCSTVLTCILCLHKSCSSFTQKWRQLFGSAGLWHVCAAIIMPYTWC